MVSNPRPRSAGPCRGFCQDVLGPLAGTDKNLDLTIPVAQVEVVSEPSALLPAKIALPPDAGSFALAINGAAHCWATSGPAVVSVPGQLLCGVRSQSGVVCPRGVIHPLKTALPAVFGLVFFTLVLPVPLLSTLLFSNLQFIHFWF